MPLNSSPVTTNRKALEEKIAAAKGNLHVNCGFWGGIIPGNTEELADLLECGVLGFKAFLSHSGIDEFPNVSEADLRKSLPILKKYQLPLLVHSELEVPHPRKTIKEIDCRSYGVYLQSRPKEWEDTAIQLMIDLCHEFGTPIHIVHLSSSNAIEILKRAKEQGIPITVETCPHYLFFNAEDIGDGQTQFKCAPPIREKENNDLLWNALKDGLFHFIVTDHSPAIPALKELESGNFKKAWGGIAGLQFGLSAIWTKAKERGFSIVELSKLMSFNVAKFLQMESRKGKIAVGYDADLMVWDPEESFEVSKDIIRFRHKVTPYLGQCLHGVVCNTFVGGHKVYDKGKFCELAKGRLIFRQDCSDD